jgi:hypothetical protein
VEQVLGETGTQTTQALPVSVREDPLVVSVATTSWLVLVDQAHVPAVPA